MENFRDANSSIKNINYASSDGNYKFDPQAVIDESENKYDSHPEKKPHQSEAIINDEQDRSSYKNVDEHDPKVEDFDENRYDLGNTGLDQNGYPRIKNSFGNSI
ncbi:hypothetical protein [Flavobacterium sp.]|uniref:hypothetical protein n=1 Tax=Flavobacterium sp. TaxID=239 RepID=UPI00286E17BD|nr:hypothetical protein [Flavobacterium sp.]